MASPYGQGLDADVRPEPALEKAPRRLGAQVGRAAGPCVVAVDVRNQGAVRRTPGIHVEAAGRAEEARGAFNQHCCQPPPGNSSCGAPRLRGGRATGLDELPDDRQNRNEDDEERDDREVLLDDLDVAEDIAQAEAGYDPQEWRPATL